MSHQQFQEQHQQWRQELEEAWTLMEEAQIAAMEERDKQFREELAEKFPMLRAWPGKDTK